MNVLALNAGSSSLKYQLIAMPSGEAVVKGNVEHAGVEGTADAIKKIVEDCRTHGIDAVGHRIVHGGTYFSEPVLIDHRVVNRLRGLRGLDPLHNPVQVTTIEAVMSMLPSIPSVACFDTAFHRTIPDVAGLYAVPHALSAHFELRRYGFHGLSHAYVARTVLEQMGKGAEGTRIITCHLGNGASVCAIKDGKSVDTSMGLTPLEGLVMGTRSGDVDAGLLLFLLREEGMPAAELDHVLNEKSGLLGLSGFSSDVRELEASTEPLAAFALDAFAYRVRKYIGAYAAVLGGVDAVVFAGGIGEHSAGTRARICSGLEFLGVTVDVDANKAAVGANARIDRRSTAVEVWVIPTNEEWEMARSVAALCG